MFTTSKAQTQQQHNSMDQTADFIQLPTALNKGWVVIVEAEEPFPSDFYVNIFKRKRSPEFSY